MALSRLSPSRSKREFLEHIGLSEDNEYDRRVYRDMMDEAALARERMCQDPRNLTTTALATPGVKPPYSSNMISENAQHQEVRRLYQQARPSTLAQYEKGIFYDGSNWDNWVIRWCLWHVFRYRDERNRNRSQRGSSYYPVMEELEVMEPGAVIAASPQSTVYDPVRNKILDNRFS